MKALKEILEAMDKLSSEFENQKEKIKRLVL